MDERKARCLDDAEAAMWDAIHDIYGGSPLDAKPQSIVNLMRAAALIAIDYVEEEQARMAEAIGEESQYDLG